jgi:hypothetical protein
MLDIRRTFVLLDAREYGAIEFLHPSTHFFSSTRSISGPDHTTGVCPKENLGSSPTGCCESDFMIVTASKPDSEGFNAKWTTIVHLMKSETP